MSNPDTGNRNGEESVYEDILRVIETLDKPKTISAIADRADVAPEAVDEVIEQLLTENTVKKYVVGGEEKYGPDPVQILFKHIEGLVREKSRGELEASLIKYTSQVESLQAEYDVETLSELRAKFVEEDLTAEEMREVRNVVSTWEALETEIRLSKHALQLYEDIAQLLNSQCG
jgi:DNA-binding Lrp family transcriptional regulator